MNTTNTMPMPGEMLYQEEGLARVQETSGLALVVERLAANPDVDVAKLEKIIELQERILAHQAEAEFNSAFALMQPEIPTIIERKQGDAGKWMFAPLEDIIAPMRQILSRHGFSISHSTEWPDGKTVKVIGLLTHRGGHARRSEFQATADQTGSKNAIQALGSSVSYGKRYTTKDLLCIVTAGEDDDGHRSSAPSPPDGFEDWWDDFQLIAEGGLKTLEAEWKKAKPDFKSHVVKHMRDSWESLKKRAAAAS
jgi:hypothetical protein